MSFSTIKWHLHIRSAVKIFHFFVSGHLRHTVSTIRGIQLSQVANQLIEMYLILMLIIMFCAKLPNDISFTSP